MSKKRYYIATRALYEFDYAYDHGFIDDELAPLDFIVRGNFGGDTEQLPPVIKKAFEVMGPALFNPDLPHLVSRQKLIELKRACR